MADAFVETARQALSKGADYLLAQQAADGGWHSQTYGQLKDGAAATALVCYALAFGATEMRPERTSKITKALAFLQRGLAKRGTIASPDGSLDFPTYAGALWLLARGRVAGPDADGKRVLDYLVEAQVAEPRGFEPDSPSYGGWDFLGKEDAQGITTGTNVSVTRHVVEALQARQSATDLATARALKLGKAYLERCQNPDGGFAFTCEPMSQNNKAAYADDKLAEPRSYGTATCDGVLGLLACATPADDERIVKAIAWLAKRPGLELVPGFEGLPPEAGWQRGLRFYYYAGLARVLALFPKPDIAPRREALVKHLTSLQQAEGYWVNESDRMRENDPLIATSLAIIALAACVAG